MKQQIRFNPWVGSKYASGGFMGRKILVLGESHYDDEDNAKVNKDFTIDTIREWAIQKRGRFFIVVAKAVLGMPAGIYLDDDKKKEFWESVAFYNYIQQLVGDGPRCRPKWELWEPAKEPFLQVLRELKPNICIAFGNELFSHLPSPDSKEEKDGCEIYCYQNNNGCVTYLAGLTHPAGGLGYSEAHRRIKALFEISKSL